MVWGMIGALEEEVRLIRESMRIEKEVEAYGTTFYVGELYGQRMIAVCCSVGTINAAVCASTIIRELGATAVVFAGVAGAMDPSLKILDVVLSDELVFHDAQVDMIEKYYPFKRSFAADRGLLELAKSVIESMEDRGFRYQVGKVATGDTFVESSVLKELIMQEHQPLCVEMEGAAVAQVAYMNAVPFLVIRSMSDNAEDDADLSFDEFLHDAANNSSRILLGMVERYGKQNG